MLHFKNLTTLFIYLLLNIRSPVPSTSQITNTLANQHNDIYDADTDVDSDSEIPHDIDILADKSNIPLPSMEDVFRNCSFYLSTRLKHSLNKECHRYILALDG